MLYQLERNIARLAVKGIPGLNLCCISIAVHLNLYYNSICCHERAYICGNVSTMQYHLKNAHAWKSGSKSGRPLKANQEKGKTTAVSTVTISPVYYQTFHVSNFQHNFRALGPAQLAVSSVG
jgi:hypothetical protein